MKAGQKLLRWKAVSLRSKTKTKIQNKQCERKCTFCYYKGEGYEVCNVNTFEACMHLVVCT